MLTGPVHDCDEPSLLLSMRRLFSLLACYSKGEQLCHEMQLIVAVAIALFIIKQLSCFHVQQIDPCRPTKVARRFPL